jgi:large subunit ribosomal protein L24
MSLRIRKGDQVAVLSGKAKGKKGKLVRLSPDGSRGYVEGVNLVKRFVRKTRQNPQGGEVHQETSIHISNLALVDPKSGKPTRFRQQILEDKTKRRISTKSGADLG